MWLIKSGIHRSVLISKSLLQFHTLNKIKHSHLWLILGCGVNLDTLNFLEASPDLNQWLGTSAEELKTQFYGSMATKTQNQDILTNIFPKCLSLQVGEHTQAPVKFVVESTVEDVNVYIA